MPTDILLGIATLVFSATMITLLNPSIPVMSEDGSTVSAFHLGLSGEPLLVKSPEERFAEAERAKAIAAGH
jgi:hypothetical protein